MVHFHDSNPRREKTFRLPPAGLPEFPEPDGDLRGESSAEYLGSRFLASLSFGVPTMELSMFQPVARDTERGCRGGTRGSSGVDGSIGTSDGDGAVDGRLRIGRRLFGGDLTVLALSGVRPTP